MKEYITIKCNGETALYKAEAVISAKLKSDGTIEIVWGLNGDSRYVDKYYPNSNAQQIFNRLMKDLGANEEKHKTKEI